MKFLLVAVNASFSHTCLAVRQLSAFTGIEFIEFTINQPVGEILRGIKELNPDVVLFSTYIWNGEIISKIIPDIKKILPKAIIGAGGPEFGFAASIYLKKLPSLDFIMHGEGEKTLEEIQKKSDSLRKDSAETLSSIKGVFYRDCENNIIFSGERELICDLSELHFAYPSLKSAYLNQTGIPLDLQNKIFYYESSRGCPFKCSYCMSSLDLRVRFMPLERVFEDLKIFLEQKVPLVKFVDRTYNLDSQRYIAIWKFIKENHNGITMFHFEIEAEFLSEEALDFLQTVPSGIMQFEIGVQSSNKQTLKAINRSDNIEKLAENIKRLPSTIHQHLDLIAGLPYENLESFGKSFDFVMALKPDALQLGFLKVLHGTIMEKYAKENGWKWMENPVYETFSTPYMSYEDMTFLKDLEVCVDAFWNSGVFVNLMKYIGRKMSFWSFFYALTKESQKKQVFTAARRESFWFSLIFQFINEDLFPALNKSVMIDLLRYDFVKRGKQGNFPEWYNHRYDKERHRILLDEKEGINNARIGFAFSEYECFDYDVTAEEPELQKMNYELLLQYPKRLK